MGVGGYESESATHKRDIDRERKREKESVYICVQVKQLD